MRSSHFALRCEPLAYGDFFWFKNPPQKILEDKELKVLYTNFKMAAAALSL